MSCDRARNVRFDDVRNHRLLVALSGGADSVALLVLLCRQRAELNLDITAAHLHHGIRGADADADAHCCETLCQQLQVPFILEHADVPALAKAQNLGLETAARNARYAFLHRAQRACGADLIALAHHMNDQSETILMHLFRGAGSDGISGMARLKNGLYRPLLEVSKAELRQFLEEEGICWREDRTNALADNPRNALRLNVMPEIEKSYPMAASAIARYGRIARAENELLSRMTHRFLSERTRSGAWGIQLRLEAGDEPALLRRAVRLLCDDSIGMDKTDAILELSKCTRGKLTLSKDMQVEKTPTALYFLPQGVKKTAPVVLNVPGETILQGICRIVAEVGNFSIDPGDPTVEVADAAALEGAVVRTRANGDRFQPLGTIGDKLLSDYLIDRKIDRPLRDWLPLVARDQRILWVCGTGLSQDASLQSKTLRTVRLKIYFTDETAEVHL